MCILWWSWCSILLLVHVHLLKGTQGKIALGSICSNSPSPCMCLMRKCVYILMMLHKALYIELKSSIRYFLFLDNVIEKGMALMYIMSIANEIALYCSGLIKECFFLVVFALRAPISGPNIVSAAAMSFLELRQFGSWLLVTIFINFCVFAFHHQPLLHLGIHLNNGLFHHIWTMSFDPCFAWF